MSIIASTFWEGYINLPDSEKWKFIRNHRAGLLAGCDWTQLNDAVLTFNEKIAWQVYRQALRDLPQQFSNPDDVVFPEKP